MQRWNATLISDLARILISYDYNDEEFVLYLYYLYYHLLRVRSERLQHIGRLNNQHNSNKDQQHQFIYFERRRVERMNLMQFSDTNVAILCFGKSGMVVYGIWKQPYLI